MIHLRLPFAAFLMTFIVLPAAAAERIAFQSGEWELTGYLCRPQGEGPFPMVVYNHGGMGDNVGGAPKETCEALAEAGYVGLSPLRRRTRSMRGHLDDVFAGVNAGLSLPYVDRRRVALMGFSRGGMLTLMGALTRNDFKAVVIMATAAGRRGQLTQAMRNLGALAAPVLVMTAKNDTGSHRTRGTLEGSRKLAQALQDAGRDVRYIEYPPYGDDGHTMFFEVGAYWKDILAFLKQRL